MVDAIGRTLWRLAVTRRHLLEWVTAAQAHARARPGRRGLLRRMGRRVALRGCRGVSSRAFGPRPGRGAAPFLVALAPLAAGRPLGQPARRADRRGASRRPQDARASRGSRAGPGASSRRSSAAEDHDLPPDNFQEDPRPVVAHRTSPTNIGLYLLSTVAARRLRWIGTARWSSASRRRSPRSRRLERYRGHLLQLVRHAQRSRRSSRATSPRSTAATSPAHLIALRHACLERLNEPLPMEERARRDRRHARLPARSRDRRRGTQPGPRRHDPPSSRPLSRRPATLLARAPGSLFRMGERQPLCPAACRNANGAVLALQTEKTRARKRARSSNGGGATEGVAGPREITEAIAGA